LYAPHLGLDRTGYQAIKTAFEKEGYVQRTSLRKGFSEDPGVMQERLDFARVGITWTRERLYNQVFSDEI